MNTMSYKNYTARIEFDGRDNIFVGCVLGLDSVVSFHGTSVTELRARFQAAVEDLLDDRKSTDYLAK
jgi:predicted HicB family RNase H-like nuclease